VTADWQLPTAYWRLLTGNWQPVLFTFARMESTAKRVLVAPLDWGLGHATRSIPIIHELQAQGAEVMICASGGGKLLLTEIFPNCRFIDIPGINIRYPQTGSMAFSMLMQMPSILKAIRTEHDQLQTIIDAYKITHTISDNRFGLYSSKTKSAFITHQVHIKSSNSLKFLEPVLFRMNQSRIAKFDELWIPDNSPPNNLSGTLSDTSRLTIKVKHLGTLSRFTKSTSQPEKKFDCIALLSGPEPQRSILEKRLVTYFNNSSKKCLVIRGMPGGEKFQETEVVKCISSISDSELQNILHPDTLLICRPGYSTLMDLAMLGHRKTLFIPTLGQTEQEYLAMEMKNKYGYPLVLQNQNFSFEDLPIGKPLPDFKNQNALKKTIGEFLS